MNATCPYCNCVNWERIEKRGGVVQFECNVCSSRTPHAVDEDLVERLSNGSDPFDPLAMVAMHYKATNPAS